MNSKGRILIVDDEETFREATADLLREEGYECGACPDAYQASQVVAGENFDLLIADIRMPGNAEMEFIQDLPNIAPNLQAIITTGYPSLETAIQSVNLPVIAYLLKPVDMDVFMKYVDAGVQHCRMTGVLEGMQIKLSNWLSEVEKVIQYSKQFPRENGMISANVLLQMSFQNILTSLVDINTMTDILHIQDKTENACALLNCPAHDRMKAAIADSIDVLEKTKGSFKSKELAGLRKRLEEIYAQC